MSSKKIVSFVSDLFTRQANHKFHTGVWLSKFIFLALLLILTYVNHYTDFIAQNPRYFFNECLLLGGCTAIAVSLIAYLRQPRLEYVLNVAFVMFLLFFVFNVLMELSGLNHASSTSTVAEGQLLVFNQSVFWLIPVAVIAIVMFVLAWNVNDHYGYRNNAQLLLEMTALGLAGAIPAFINARDRGITSSVSLATTGVETFVVFALSHFILQRGGFYSQVFREEEDDY